MVYHANWQVSNACLDCFPSTLTSHLNGTFQCTQSLCFSGPANLGVSSWARGSTLQTRRKTLSSFESRSFWVISRHLGDFPQKQVHYGKSCVWVGMVSPQVPDEALVTALSSAQIRVREKLDSIPGGIDKSSERVFSCPDTTTNWYGFPYPTESSRCFRKVEVMAVILITHEPIDVHSTYRVYVSQLHTRFE